MFMKASFQAVEQPITMLPGTQLFIPSFCGVNRGLHIALLVSDDAGLCTSAAQLQWQT